MEHWYGLVATVNEQLYIFWNTLISTKINNLNNIINTTDFKLIMECQSEAPVYIVNNKKYIKMGGGKKVRGYLWLTK